MRNDQPNSPGSLQGAGGVGDLLAEITPGGVRHPFCDGNGNITDWMDSDGEVVAHHEYDPYGNEMTGNPPTSYGFSSKPFDSTLGLYYYGYRFYRPEWGRWMNRIIFTYSIVRENEYSAGRKYVFGRPYQLRLEFETPAGASGCDLSASEGSPYYIVNNNDTCTSSCTQKHEEQHASDRQSCCDKARAAWQREGADQDEVEYQWNQYIDNSIGWSECRANTKGKECLDKLEEEKNCKNETCPSDCCESISAGQKSVKTSITFYCDDLGGSSAKEPTCPF